MQSFSSDKQKYSIPVVTNVNCLFFKNFKELGFFDYSFGYLSFHEPLLAVSKIFKLIF
jgi:hypothetical protein